MQKYKKRNVQEKEGSKVISERLKTLHNTDNFHFIPFENKCNLLHEDLQ